MGILGNGHEFVEYLNPFKFKAARNLFMEWFDLD